MARIVKRRIIEKMLAAAGFTYENGNKHRKWVHPDGRQTHTRYSKDEYVGSELKAIEKQSGIKFK
jgi:predicted RNA binding protein YcfA (HicA-like mRNA interferase family)